nr:S-layer homology domain-containing protein [Butyricicoccus faecihominis]
MKRRLLSAFLAVMMVLTMAPVAFAADGDTTETSEFVAEISGTGYATLQAAVDAAKADDTITLLKDITVDGTDKATSRTVIDKPITLDLNDKTIKSPDNMGNNNKNFAALYISADVTINATTGGINTGTNGAYAINVMNGATLTINGGNYYGGGTAVQVEKGTANINGGTFACEPYSNPTYGYKFLINCIDAAYKNGTAKVSIKGGSFVNYDPSDSASENPIGNFCASGYVAVKGGTENAPVWTVEDHRVAEVGNTGYSTLSAAVAAANNGDTVTLLTNTDEDITIAQDKDIILDLNGKKLTNVASHTIFNKGTLTINGNNGTVDNVTHGKVAVYNIGKVTLNGGTYDRSKEDGIKDSNTYYTLLNHGTMTVANVTVNNEGGYSSLFENGYFDYSKSRDGIDNPTLTIESGTFTGGINTVKNDDGATMTINGGIFTNYAQSAFQNHNIATINGGTFNGATVYAILNCGTGCKSDAAPDLHQLTITDGNFNGKIYKGGDSKDGTHYDIGSISITGGYFTTDPSAYVASGYVAGTSDVSGYSYKVVAKTNTGNVEVKPDVADPEVTVSGSISEEDKKKVENAAKTVSAPTLGAETGDIVKDINEDTAKTLIEKATTVQGNNKKLYVQSSLKVEPTAYNETTKTLALDITPQYRIVASTAATADGIELDGVTKNAQVVQDYQPMNITKATVVTMELPAGFAVAGDKLSIQHTKSNDKVEYYTGTVTEQSGKHLLTFTTNGFSPFVISVPAAAIESKVYPTLQAAVDSAKNDDIIDLYKDVAADTKVTVAKTIKFKIATNSKTFAKENIAAGANTTVKVTGDASPYTYEFTYTKPSSGSSGGSSSGKTTYKVTTSAVNNGGVNASPSSAEKGATITITLSPDKGYKLDKLTVTDGSGKTVSTVKKSDTVYTFTMPASAVKVGVSYVKATTTPSKTKFNDVSANDWFASAVDYVTGKGMMNGTADNTFSPKANTTRGMVVTVLYRLENQPSTSAASFTDVASGAYYANAVAWANANGIVSGYGSGKFGPNDKVTREQLAAILYRYAQYKKYDVSVGEDTNILSYDDAQSISSYAIPAIQWACGAGVVTGKSGSKLDSKGNATRAEVAAMLMRFCENVK